MVVFDGEGGYLSRPGQDLGGGTWSIAGVPEGTTYLLKVGTSKYVVTDERHVDLGGLVMGRPTAQRGASSGTVQVSSMTPWVDDRLFLAAPNAGLGSANLTSLAGASSGDTSLDFTFDFVSAFLIDASQGDIAYLLHQREAVGENGQHFNALYELATFDNIEQVAGQPATFTGAFEVVDRNLAATFDIRHSQFAALFPPGATVDVQVTIIAQPRAAKYGQSGRHVVLASNRGRLLEDTTLTFEYGNPIPDHWDVYAKVVGFGSWTTPDGDSTTGSVFYYDTVAATAAGPITPRLFPISAPTIDGQDATAPLSGVSLTPTIAWNPAAGATGYQVFINGGGTFYTTDTQITIPPGILESGETYPLTIQARDWFDLQAAPFRHGPLPHGQATFKAAAFTVQ